jgi:hypothetical protein
MVAGDRITGSCSSRCRFPHLLTGASVRKRRSSGAEGRAADPADGESARCGGWEGRWTGLVLGRLARRLPGGGDQSVELGPHQLVVIEHEVEEVVLDL